MIPFIAFLFGSIIGSFLNVVILRLHTGRSLNGRSHCMSCNTTLRSYELVPAISYMLQRGRCRTCTARISPRYLFVEMLTGAAFALLAYMYAHDPFALAVYLVATSVAIVIAVYDIRHTVIPDEMVLVLVGCAGLMLGRSVIIDQAYADVGFAVASAVAAGGVFALMWFLSGGRWIGLGDAKLTFALALMLGPVGTFSFVIGAFWIGTLYVAGVACVRIVSERVIHKGFSAPRYTMRSEVPFGPFLILAFAAVLIGHVDILATIQSLADSVTIRMYRWFFHY